MKYQYVTGEGVTVGCDDTKPELAISQGFTFTDFWGCSLTHGVTLPLHSLKPVPRLPSPCLLSSPSDIAYSQGNSVLGIQAYDIVHSQLPLLLLHIAPRKTQIVRFCGERRVLS